MIVVRPFFLRRSRSEYEKVWIVGLVEVHSRFLIGLRVLPRPQAKLILAWLDDCFELCGTPLKLMSDNGSPFVVWMPGVLTLFGKTLDELRIRHLRTQVNSPWTNGKIERFWGVLKSELLDREIFRTVEAAADGLTRFATWGNPLGRKTTNVATLPYGEGSGAGGPGIDGQLPGIGGIFAWWYNLSPAERRVVSLANRGWLLRRWEGLYDAMVLTSGFRPMPIGHRQLRMEWMIKIERNAKLSAPARAYVRREITAAQGDLFHHPEG